METYPVLRKSACPPTEVPNGAIPWLQERAKDMNLPRLERDAASPSVSRPPTLGAEVSVVEWWSQQGVSDIEVPEHHRGRKPAYQRVRDASETER